MCVEVLHATSIYTSRLFPSGVTTEKLSPASLDLLLAMLCPLPESSFCRLSRNVYIIFVTSYLVEIIHKLGKCDSRSYADTISGRPL